MDKDQELQQDFTAVQEEEEEAKETNGSTDSRYKTWIQLGFFGILVLSCQSAATLLGRLYFDRGGNCKWMETLVQTVGFPILIPFFCFITTTTEHNQNQNQNQSTPPQRPPPLMVLGLVYLVLGILLATSCMLFSVGLSYLPVSTFSLITATQLGFNAIFSFFINSHKFTPFIINSVVLLTISSALLVFQSDSSSNNSKISSKSKRTTGFVCALCAAALYSLSLSLTQLTFTKVIKKINPKALIEVIIWQASVATLVIIIGLFASGEWKKLEQEMNEYKLGKISYLMTLIWTAICWQIFTVGMFGLIVKASSLFANVISTLCLPVVPILAVIIFNDSMNGVKIISMIIAFWGFISYIYQHYLDDRINNFKSGSTQNVPQISLSDQRA